MDLSPLKPGSVKICGLREPEHAVAAARAEADLLGFIFAPSKRQITPGAAQACLDAAHETGNRPLAVGVFVNASVAEMNAVAEQSGIDLFQIHGDSSAVDLSALNRPAVIALHPKPEQSQDDIEAIMRHYSSQSTQPIAYLIDGYKPAEYGGVGVRADWELARELAADWPVMLAGGLTPENVGAAVARVSPLAVDVSSGIETDGRKDTAKIEAFIAAAKAAIRTRV